MNTSATRKHRLDPAKAAEVLLYVTQRVSDMYAALKIIYFADVEHLRKYGCFMYGESYPVMSYGPVPSMAYDIVKAARGNGMHLQTVPAEELFSVVDNEVTPLRQPQMRLLSESETRCLDAATKEHGRKTFEQLKRESQGDPVVASAAARPLTEEDVAATLPNAEILLDYLHNG